MTDKCIICKNNNMSYRKANFLPFLIERMFDNNDKEIELISCPTCDINYASYRPNNEEMAKLYKDYRGEEYQIQREKLEDFYTKELNFALGNDTAELEFRKKLIFSTLSKFTNIEKIKFILDFGGDKGQFIPQEFKDSSKYVYDISGIETVEGVKPINKESELNKRKWDLILCNHVLEHVDYPMNIVSTICKLIKPGGFIYIEVPYEDYFENFDENNPIPIHEHINFFRQKTFNYMFNPDEFAILENNIIEHTNCLGRNKIISVLIKKYSANKLICTKIKRFLQQIFSVKNDNNWHKVVTILGIKIKFKDTKKCIET